MTIHIAALMTSKPSLSRLAGRGWLPALALLLAGVAGAQDDESRVAERIERQRERIQAAVEEPGLTNRWFGAGPWLEEHGIRFAATVTAFGQDPWAGDGVSSSEFGGKLDGLLRMDLSRLGGWEGLNLTVHPEYNIEDSANGFGGTLLPLH